MREPSQSLASGLIDTNVFIHAYANDAHTSECRRFLVAVEQGRVEAHLEPMVLHELSYALPRYIKQITRDQLAAYMLMVLKWAGVRGERDLMADAVHRWHATRGLSFVDAFLAARASRDNGSVFTKNIQELRGQGMDVPDPLPG